jgi:hypothetical protein
MRDWYLNIIFHWPHDRFLLGTEFIRADETFKYDTIILYLFIVTLELNIES